jgi:hypothetical protein
MYIDAFNTPSNSHTEGAKKTAWLFGLFHVVKVV